MRPSKGLNSFSLSVSGIRETFIIMTIITCIGIHLPATKINHNMVLYFCHCLPGPFQAVTSISMPKKSFPLETVRAFS